MGNMYNFLGGNAVRAWSWPLISNKCLCQEYLDLCAYSPIHLHGLVLKLLCTEITSHFSFVLGPWRWRQYISMTSQPIILSELLTASLNKQQTNIKIGGREMYSCMLTGDQCVFELCGLGGVGSHHVIAVNLRNLYLMQEPGPRVTICLQHKCMRIDLWLSLNKCSFS
jgi:hypothetical protein